MIYDDLLNSPSPRGYNVNRHDAADTLCPAPGADSYLNSVVCLNGALRAEAKTPVLLLWLQFKEPHQRGCVLKTT